MQSLGLSLSKIASRFDISSEDQSTRSQFAWAVIGTGVMVSALIGSAVVYLHPLNTQIVTVDMPETGGLTAGNEVRIAGIPVGKVTEVALARDHVEAQLAVKTGIEIGDQTALDVRMLTPVGGLYAELIPLGSRSLGDAHIAKDKVQLPFQVSKIVEEAPPIVRQLDVDALRQSILAIDNATTAAPGSLGSIVESAHLLIDVFAQQKTQMGALFDVVNEFTGAVDSEKDAMLSIFHQFANVQNVLLPLAAEGKVAIENLASVITKAATFMAGVYQERIEPILPQLESLNDSMQSLVSQVDDALNSLRGGMTKLANLVGPDGQLLLDQSAGVINATNICLPVPGRSC
jgi:phospholipid/cholesterol/gamma-HCH transport system substrate-binding protein